MNHPKLHAGTYLGIGLGLWGFSYLPGVSNSATLQTLGVTSLLVMTLFLLSLRFRWRLLIKVVDSVSRINVTHIAIFLTLIGFALGIINANHTFAVLVILVAYIMLGWIIGQQLGRDVIRPLFEKWNIFQPSMKIPKDI